MGNVLGSSCKLPCVSRYGCKPKYGGDECIAQQPETWRRRKKAFTVCVACANWEYGILNFLQCNYPWKQCSDANITQTFFSVTQWCRWKITHTSVSVPPFKCDQGISIYLYIDHRLNKNSTIFFLVLYKYNATEFHWSNILIGIQSKKVLIVQNKNSKLKFKGQSTTTKSKIHNNKSTSAFQPLSLLNLISSDLDFVVAVYVFGI